MPDTRSRASSAAPRPTAGSETLSCHIGSDVLCAAPQVCIDSHVHYSVAKVRHGEAAGDRWARGLDDKDERAR